MAKNTFIVIFFILFAFSYSMDTAMRRAELLKIFLETRQPAQQEIKQNWEQFKDEKVRDYKTIEEVLKYKTFTDNYNIIEQENFINEQMGSDLKLGVNDFADMSKEEFEVLAAGTVVDQAEHDAAQISFIQKINEQKSQQGFLDKQMLLQQSLPTSVDWFSAGFISPVKNQGACGSCYSFSAVGAVEGLYKLTYQNRSQINFSDQQAVDCSASYSNLGCSGGSQTFVFKYIRDNGLALQSLYPYVSGTTGKIGTCTYRPSLSSFKISSYAIGFSRNSLALQKLVAQRPVSASLYASTSTFQLYKSGVYTESTCPTSVNHGILIVGYGKTSAGQNYWIVKNSWGTSWGNQGLIWVGFNPTTDATTQTDLGQCGIQQYPSYPIF